MIDWSKVTKSDSQAWVTLADQLVSKGQFQISASPPDKNAIDGVMADMADFVDKANTRCPVEAIDAIRRAISQMSQFSLANAISNSELKSATLDAIGARLSSAANELRANAAWLRLEPVRRAMSLVASAVAKVQAIEAAVSSLPKKDIAGRLAAILQELETAADEMKSATS